MSKRSLDSSADERVVSARTGSQSVPKSYSTADGEQISDSGMVEDLSDNFESDEDIIEIDGEDDEDEDEITDESAFLQRKKPRLKKQLRRTINKKKVEKNFIYLICRDH